MDRFVHLESNLSSRVRTDHTYGATNSLVHPSERRTRFAMLPLCIVEFRILFGALFGVLFGVLFGARQRSAQPTIRRTSRSAQATIGRTARSAQATIRRRARSAHATIRRIARASSVIEKSQNSRKSQSPKVLEMYWNAYVLHHVSRDCRNLRNWKRFPRKLTACRVGMKCQS